MTTVRAAPRCVSGTGARGCAVAEPALRRVSIGLATSSSLRPQPDFRWHELSAAAIEITRRFGVREWLSLGAIPAAVPHTRAVPLLGTKSRPGLLRGDVEPGPEGVLQVPAAAVSVLDVAVAAEGVAAVGYFAQIRTTSRAPTPRPRSRSSRRRAATSARCSVGGADRGGPRDADAAGRGRRRG